MKRQRRSLLGPLLDQVPPGFLVDARWLAANGMGAGAVSNYLDRGWLERLTRGVYRRPLPGGTPRQGVVPWKTALLSLQWVMKCDVHMGGLSTLDLLEDSCRQQPAIHIYGEAPAWLMRLKTSMPFTVHPRRMFGDDNTGIERTLEVDRQSDRKMALWNWAARVSSRERALMEILGNLRSEADFDHVDTTFRRTHPLRSRLMMELLAACRSMTARRLFFVFADRHRHTYLKDMDRSAIDLGRGPRTPVSGGEVHPKYNVHVPKGYMPDAGEADHHE